MVVLSTPITASFASLPVSSQYSSKGHQHLMAKGALTKDGKGKRTHMHKDQTYTGISNEFMVNCSRSVRGEEREREGEREKTKKSAELSEGVTQGGVH